MRVVFSAGAKVEREQAIRYLALRSPLAGAKLIRQLRATALLLGRNPWLGRTGQVEGTREWVMPNAPYILVYRVDEERQRVEVLHLHHMSRKR